MDIINARHMSIDIPKNVLPGVVPKELAQNWFRTVDHLDIADLMAYLDAILFDMMIDVSPNKDDQFTKECISYFHQAVLNFEITIYKKDDAFILEFVHSIGDRFGFIDIVKKFANYLHDNQLIPPIKKHIILPELPLDSTIVVETVSNCLIIIRKGTMLLQEDSLQYLAHLSEQEAVQNALLTDRDCIAELQAMVYHPSPTIHRCAVAILANLFSGKYGNDVLSLVSITDMTAYLTGLVVCTDIAQVVRNSARCLKNICLFAPHMHTYLRENNADVLQRCKNIFINTEAK